MNILSAPMFGSKHLIGVLIVLALLLIVFYVFKKFNLYNKSNQLRVIIVFTILFYLLEFLKLGYTMYPTWEFPMYHLPFHLCSLPLYLYPLLIFVPSSSKFMAYISSTAFATIMFAAILAFAYPSNILGGSESWFPVKDNVLPLISFTYHGLMIFSSIYLIKSRMFVPTKDSYIKAITVTLVFGIMGIIVNYLFDKDFMLLTKGNGSPLQFLIETSQVLYTLSMILIGLIFIVLTIFISSKLIKK